MDAKQIHKHCYVMRYGGNCRHLQLLQNAVEEEEEAPIACTQCVHAFVAEDSLCEPKMLTEVVVV